MKTPIISGGIGPATGYTTYCSISGNRGWTNNTPYAGQTVASAGTIGNFIVKLVTAPGSGQGWTFTLQKNGVDTSVAVTISNTSTTSTYSGNVSVVAGDVLRIKAVPSGTPEATGGSAHTLLFDGSTSEEAIIMGIFTCNSGSTVYSPLAHGLAGVSITDETLATQIIPCAGTIKNLYVDLDSAPGTGANAYRFTLRTGSASSMSSSTLTCTITGTATTAHDTAHTVAVSAGDYVSLMIEAVSSPSNAPTAHFGFTFVPTTDGEAPLLGSPYTNVYNAGTPFAGYGYVICPRNTDVDSAGGAQISQATTIKKLYTSITAAPGAGSTYTATFRKNGSDQTLTASISGASDTAANDTVHSDSVSDGDHVNFHLAASANINQEVKWSCTSYIEPSVPSVSVVTIPTLLMMGIG